AGSVYTPTKDTSGSSFDPTFDVQYLPEQDAGLLKKYFMVEGEQLLQLFRFCPQCGLKIPGGNTVRLLQQGTAPVVHFLCARCSLEGEQTKRWEGQKRATLVPNDRMYKGNVVAAVAAITTGLRFVELERWAKQFGLALFSKSTFWRYFERTKPAVEEVYGRHQSEVLSKDGLDLAADGAYDSRGYSALIGKVAMCDLGTKLRTSVEGWRLKALRVCCNG
ncbi:hypothetical protein NECAME_18063, partial [Necator americanus]